MRFSKYQALGNDYLIIEPPAELDAARVRRICDRHYGVGSDGILFGPGDHGHDAGFGLRIFNPDGSEAEKSGNGLRIFARYLFDRGRVGETAFRINTAGGEVEARVESDGSVTVAMGRVSFLSSEIPVAGPVREVLDETLELDDPERGPVSLRYCAAGVGNPHCVVLCERPPDAEVARRLGPLIERDQRFPNRTNVQFLQILDRERIAIQIWERGAGYTLASGSSSTAAAAVAHRLGRCGRRLTVSMPGGELNIDLDEAFRATMRGPVAKIADGVIAAEMLDSAAGRW